ncbi:IPT/TIG domain-containing protein [Puia dinghuensis]|uniref:IPT/TIG domain-containing protein n=1 Tax=Puia dinghuensis TaxID=1792502 RepID=A0A8J2U7Y4_9BACT|nr:IPT/TIG domain-containing protein [Puia dinghuensis]GGA84901.1 hypothetical protein GCM10011511_04920 [Puia dinghuensis]
MKMRNVTFILVLGILILFSMCNKVNPPAAPGNPPPPIGGGGRVDTGANGKTNPPQLVSFSPETGAIGDTISITGTGYFNDITVSFGNTLAQVISVINTTNNNVKTAVITVLVPSMPDITTKINVKVDTLLLTSDKNFTRTSITQFSGFSPASGFIGDTITITGVFYKTTPDVKFGDVRAWVYGKDSKTLKVVVPNEIDNANPTISVIDGQTMTSATPFQLKAPVIDSISPKTAYLGQVIRIKGKGFRNSYLFNQVYMDNSAVSTYPESTTSIPVDTKNAGLGTHGFAVEVAGLKTLAKDSVKLIALTAPVIDSITPDTLIDQDILTIYGHHFLSPDPNDQPTTVSTLLNGIVTNFNILDISDDRIQAMNPYLSDGKYKITVTVLASSVTYGTPFTYIGTP